MATYDDYDGVYFSVMAIRLFHPEVTDETEIVVVDNHPDGPCAADLKALENWVSGYRYVPFNRLRGTAVRDMVFREATSRFCAVHGLPRYVRRRAHCATDRLLQSASGHARSAPRTAVYDDLTDLLDPYGSYLVVRYVWCLGQ